MDEEIERLVVSVRADTQGFARDVADMRAQLDGPLGAGAERAGQMIENALMRAVRTGKLGFEDLKRVALSVMAEIASNAIGNGIGAMLGGGGLASAGANILSTLLGVPGRATGGPVSPGRAYLVGERGPELFVPTSSGSVAAPATGARDVRVTINFNAPAGSDAPQMLTRSARQVARAVRVALAE
ncbi:tail tape measure protein [Sphingomonas cavernae]|uniref:Tail tape measure protein n=1 Tax=Sphingomonas cavernae TaxID=2320861 RepID=A0A418WLQ1_9SPHN|nr:tail tape measure protein [Sphingomonas cavernae]RJF90789.1 tail tape measure protein [Sphingomonas cavernae]